MLVPSDVVQRLFGEMVPNYGDNYHVTNDGRVFSFEKNRWLKPSYSMNVKGVKTGYMCQTLKVNGKIKRLYIHRLVAEVYLPKDQGDEWVNHKDGNKSNNHVENLEWCTISENIQHSFDVLGRAKSAPKPWLGRNMSDKHKQKLSEAKKGTKHPKFNGYYCFKNSQTNQVIKAANPRELKEKTGINISTVALARRCKKGLTNYWFESVTSLTPKP